jgi:hypothetical protein
MDKKRAHEWVGLGLKDDERAELQTHAREINRRATRDLSMCDRRTTTQEQGELYSIGNGTASTRTLCAAKGDLGDGAQTPENSTTATRASTAGSRTAAVGEHRQRGCGSSAGGMGRASTELGRSVRAQKRIELELRRRGWRFDEQEPGAEASSGSSAPFTSAAVTATRHASNNTAALHDIVTDLCAPGASIITEAGKLAAEQMDRGATGYAMDWAPGERTERGKREARERRTRAIGDGRLSSAG